MLIYTAVASLAPLAAKHRSSRGSRGTAAALPPDMLSGGGRQILASYTAFGYQGNFVDVACRLIDTLPHQSPAASMVSKQRGYSLIDSANGRQTQVNIFCLFLILVLIAFFPKTREKVIYCIRRLL